MSPFSSLTWPPPTIDTPSFSPALAPSPQRPLAQIPTSTRSHPSTSREVKFPELTRVPVLLRAGRPCQGLGGARRVAVHNSTEQCPVLFLMHCFHIHGLTSVTRGEVRELGAGGRAWADRDLCPQSPWEAALRASTSSRTSSSSHPSSLRPSRPTPTSQPRSKPTTGHARRRWPLWVGKTTGEGKAWLGPRLIALVDAP